jgi:hypothetical protein
MHTSIHAYIQGIGNADTRDNKKRDARKRGNEDKGWWWWWW